jgi:uncharacterized lipoprotein YehR (DUF1307 family)
MFKKISTVILLTSLVLFFAGCPNDDDDDNKTRTYKISLKNITLSQPFAPAAIIVQNSTTNFNAYEVGHASSIGLETLAEGGNPQVLLDEAESAKVLYTNKFDGITNPGSTKELTFTVDNKDLKLSAASMLVKTNDAFIGVNNIDLNFSGTKTFNLNVYDAGTEANDELATTVPGLNGEGFNSLRNDTKDIVTLHSGVVTKDDGLLTSGLSFSDKWNNPAAILTIERIK